MKVIIAGANGFLGQSLAEYFVSRGHEVVELVRGEGHRPHGRAVRWDGCSLGGWVGELDGAELLVNLAGRSVNCRYHRRNRDEILRSRTESTRILGQAVAQCTQPPRTWINASTATIYRHAEDRPQDEFNGEIGEGFSVEVAEAWEKEFFAVRVPGPVRKVALRTALVLGTDRGTVFDYFAQLARMGLGGPMGSGRQMVSWIHLTDFCRAVLWLAESHEVEGVVNLAAPGPVSNREFMRVMRHAVGRNWGIPSPQWMLEIGTRLLSTEAELVLKSRWVLPTRLERAGFRFEFGEIADAVADLVARWRAPRVSEGKKSTPGK